MDHDPVQLAAGCSALIRICNRLARRNRHARLREGRDNHLGHAIISHSKYVDAVNRHRRWNTSACSRLDGPNINL